MRKRCPPESAAAMVDLTGPFDPLASGCSHRDPDEDDIEFDAFPFPGEAEQGNLHSKLDILFSLFSNV